MRTRTAGEGASAKGVPSGGAVHSSSDSLTNVALTMVGPKRQASMPSAASRATKLPPCTLTLVAPATGPTRGCTALTKGVSPTR